MTDEFTTARPMLFGLAYRLLGSVHDAEDAVQDAYLRWSAGDRSTVAEPRRYLSRIVTRVALDRLRARQESPETYVGEWLPEPVPTDPDPFEPAEAVTRRESLAIATLHLLERLNPIERAVYVLRTAFELPYAEIAEWLDRATDDCRQLYHRANERVLHGRTRFTASRAEQQRLLNGFVAAAGRGDVPELLTLLAEDVTAWSDGGGRVRSARHPIVGANRVARFFAGIYGPAKPAIQAVPIEVNGHPGMEIRRGHNWHVLVVAGTPDRITGVYLISNPDKLPPPASAS